MANFRQVLEETVQKHSSRIAFTLKNKAKEYRDITFAEFYRDVQAVATSMIMRGMAGERIALAANNQYTWVLGYLGTQLSGGISVPLDKGLKHDELEFSLGRVKATYLLYDKAHKKPADDILGGGSTSLKGIIAIDDCEENSSRAVNSIEVMIGEGRAEIDANGTKLLDEIVIDDNALAVLLFTSGTTSLAKIVMLSQHNLATNIISTSEVEDIRETDTSIAFLPYHHIFGSTGQWIITYCGARTVYCDGLKYIQKNLVEYGVSIFVGVPLIAEAMYKKVILKAKKDGSLGKLQFITKVSNALLKVGIDKRKFFFKTIHDAFGGHLRSCILGGAAPDPECIKGFKNWGILAFQGYGLTETSPVIIAENADHLRAGSIGVPNKGVEIRIEDQDEKGIGEIVARGENVMLGYYENEEATNEVLIDGWFHTGDLAYMDKDGFIYIAGRKKNVIVLKNGKKVFPEELELLLAKLPYSKEAVVLGVPEPDDERDLVVTLKMVYDPEAFPGMTYDEIRAKVKADVEEINETTPRYKRIQRIILTDQEMIKTSSGKVKRYLEVEQILKERKNG